jgi:hypothetical protein
LEFEQKEIEIEDDGMMMFAQDLGAVEPTKDKEIK